MRKKSLFAKMISVGLISAITLTGCGATEKKNNNQVSTSDASTAGQQEAATKLVYYTIGNPDNDLQMVNDGLNDLLLKKCNVTIDYNKVGWGDYGTKMSNIINSGGDFDIAFASGVEQGDYAGNAEKGAWLELDDFLANEGKALYDSISPLFWEGVTIDGHIYGIPTNKEVAVPERFMYPKDFVDKYNIDITKYTTLESLEDVFAQIKASEPDYLIMELDSQSHNFFALDGYEYVLSKQVPLMVKSSDGNLEVINIFDTDYAKGLLTTLRKYYLAGYINEDAAVKESGGLEKDKKVFWKMASGGPYSETSWSTDRGYEVVSQQVTETVVTTESARGALMTVNKFSENVDAAYDFLLTLNTDAEVRNMMNYGIEGTHYELDGNNQVVTLSDTYQGVQYTQGNWFILNTRVGEPADKWKTYQEFNDSAVASELLGFQADTKELTTEIAAITTVWNKYYSSLMTGSIEIDTVLPQFVQELKDAGIEKVQKTLQSQIDAWKTEK